MEKMKDSNFESFEERKLVENEQLGLSGLPLSLSFFFVNIEEIFIGGLLVLWLKKQKGKINLLIRKNNKKSINGPKISHYLNYFLNYEI